MIKTPTKPPTTAAIRRGPTVSPRSGIDISVMSSGAMKKSAVALVSGMTASAAKNAMFETTISSPRMRWANGLSVLSAAKPPSN